MTSQQRLNGRQAGNARQAWQAENEASICASGLWIETAARTSRYEKKNRIKCRKKSANMCIKCALALIDDAERSSCVYRYIYMCVYICVTCVYIARITVSRTISVMFQLPLAHCPLHPPLTRRVHHRRQLRARHHTSQC